MRGVFSSAVAMALSIVGSACGGGSEARQEAGREQIRVTLESYLPLLGEAYASGDFSALEPWVAQKEISSIHKRVEDLAVQGRTLVPTFRRVTIEDVNIWNNSNAYVTTHEVWDLVVFATGTDQILSQVIEQPNRVKYQMKRENDRWRVLFRTIQE